MKNKLTIVLLAILLLPSVWSLFGSGYFSMHDDLQVMRIYEMERCLNDGQIPCRWAPDMAFGYGQPMFNFYSTFPYYLGALIRIVSPFSILATVRILFMLALLGSGVGMYLLAREFFGRTGGVLASVLYVYAPYHALDIYVRGALAESFALAIIPFVWLYLYCLIKKRSFSALILTAISLFFLFTTHNISSLLFSTPTIIWVVYWTVKTKRYKAIVDVGVAGVVSLGLSSFFLLPNLVEQGLIQKEFLTINYLNYNAHFVTLRQLFIERDWGFGPSIFGPKDNLSFAVGWPHWWLGIIVGLVLFWKIIRRKKMKYFQVIVGLLILAGLTTFLTHSKSVPLWKQIEILSFVQFPWRFLGLTIFFLSFASGALVKVNKFIRPGLATLAVLLAVVLNVGYFAPERQYRNETDQGKLSGENFVVQQKSAILDYLPKTSPIAPRELAPENPQVIEGDANAFNFSKSSNAFFFDAEVFREEALIEIPVIYYPGWTVIEGTEVVESEPGGDYGAIQITLNEGKHIVQGRFYETPLRKLANAITVVSLFLLLGASLIKIKTKKFLWY